MNQSQAIIKLLLLIFYKAASMRQKDVDKSLALVSTALCYINIISVNWERAVKYVSAAVNLLFQR